MIKRKRKRNPLDEITRIQLVKYLADAEKNGSYDSLKHALFILENNGDICKNCSNLYGEDLCDCYTCPRDYDEYEEPCEDIDFCVCDQFGGQPKKKEIKEYANELINSVLTEEEIYRIVVLGNDDLQDDLRGLTIQIFYHNRILFSALEQIYRRYDDYDSDSYKFFTKDLLIYINKVKPYVSESSNFGWVLIPISDVKNTKEFLNFNFEFYFKYGLNRYQLDEIMRESIDDFIDGQYPITPITKQFIEFFLPYVEDNQLRSNLRNFFLKKQNPYAKKKPCLNSKKNTKLKISSRSNKNRL